MNIDTDKQYQEHKLKAVEPWSDGIGWTLTFEDGMGIGCQAEQCQTAPQPGETARLYGRGLGYPVRGISISGRVYRYRTEAEAEQERLGQVAKHKREKAESYEAKRAEFDARVAALPEPFRLRIERFRDLMGNEWRYEFEAYELFTCEQAVVIHDAVGAVAELETFTKLSYEEQRTLVPKLSENHSGNTFGVACQLARYYFERPDLLPKAHGAMCGLAGCKDYGCFAGHEALRGIEA